MEFEIKNHQGGKYQKRGFLFLKQDLRKILTTNPLIGLTNTKTVVVYDKGTPLKTVHKSLELLMNDIAFKIEEEEAHKENSRVTGGWLKESVIKAE